MLSLNVFCETDLGSVWRGVKYSDFYFTISYPLIRNGKVKAKLEIRTECTDHFSTLVGNWYEIMSTKHNAKQFWLHMHRPLNLLIIVLNVMKKK